MFDRKDVIPDDEKAQARRSMNVAVNGIDRGERMASVRTHAGRRDADVLRLAMRRAAAVVADLQMIDRASVRTASSLVPIRRRLAGRSTPEALPR